MRSGDIRKDRDEGRDSASHEGERYKLCGVNSGNRKFYEIFFRSGQRQRDREKRDLKCWGCGKDGHMVHTS